MSTLAFIWDLDGTLLDSYGAIVSSLYKTYLEFNIELDREAIRQEVIRTSVKTFIAKMDEQTGVPFETMRSRYTEIGTEEKKSIGLMEHAREILTCLQERGARHFVVTHKGDSAHAVLKRLGIYDFFEEIITAKDGFPRKPDPAAVDHLVEKYGLDRKKTYYVGDRTLVIDCAVNAGILSIMYLPEDSPAEASGKETYIVKDLMDISEIAEKEMRSC